MTRDEALDVMNILRFGTFEEIINTEEIVNKALDVAIEALKDRPHGEWIYHKHDKVFECSECHYHFDEDEFGLEIPQVNATWVKVCVYNFCPNCGADLRVKDELNRVNKELNSEIVKSKSEIVPDYRDGWRLKDTHAEYWDNLGIAKEGGANDRERMGEDGL